MTEHTNGMPANSDKLVTNSPSFVIEELESRTGKWIARIRYAPTGRDTGLSVTLRETSDGSIGIDYGSRGRGKRRRTGKKNRQEAVYYAEAKLEQRIRNSFHSPDYLNASIEEAGGDPSPAQCFALWLSEKADAVTPAWLKNMKRVADIVDVIYGIGQSTLSMGQDFIDDYMERRTTSAIKFTNGRRPLAPTENPGTPAKELHMVFTALEYCANRRLDSDRTQKVLKFNPLADSSIVLPPRNDIRKKRPRTLAHYALLMSPVEQEDGSFLPAPVDRVPGAAPGVTRIITALALHTNRRRRAVNLIQRSEVARTQAEVRAMLTRLEKKKLPVRPEWACYFPNGLIEFPSAKDKEGSRKDQSDLEWHRIVPISRDLAEELDLYDEITGFYNWDPESYLLPSESDRTTPLDLRKVFDTKQVRRAPRDNYRTYTSNGEAIVVQKGDVLRDKNGNRQFSCHGGWYRRAEDIVREDLRRIGANPDDHYAVYAGEVLHAWRAGNVQRVEELGYMRSVIVDANRGERIHFNVNADYVLGWKTDGETTVVHYLPLDPEVMQAIVDNRNSDEILAERRAVKSRDAAAVLGNLDALRRKSRERRVEIV